MLNIAINGSRSSSLSVEWNQKYTEEKKTALND